MGLIFSVCVCMCFFLLVLGRSYIRSRVRGFCDSRRFLFPSEASCAYTVHTRTFLSPSTKRFLVPPPNHFFFFLPEEARMSQVF